jgi:glutamate carboxypeptidase
MNVTTSDTTQLALQTAIEARLTPTLSFLEEIVGINSFTTNPAGVNENAERVIKQFTPLGFTAQRVPCDVLGSGDHLILDSGGDGPTVALISHLDTVFPAEEETANGFRWLPEGDRIYGPGTCDIKGGTAIIWMLLDALAEVEPVLFRSTRWLVICNAAEEALTAQFGDICHQILPKSTKACLVFEAGAMSGSKFTLGSARKGMARGRVKVKGCAAHSGAAYARGANAVHQMARVIERLVPLTDLERETTLNVGVVSGGTVTNRVPHEAEALFEIRAFDLEHYAEVRDAALAMSGPGDISAPDGSFTCEIEVLVEKEMPAWPQNPATERLVQVWQRVGETLGYEVIGAPRGGLSDGNWLWQRFPTLDGLGPSGSNAHVSERSADGAKMPEYMTPASLVPKTLLNCLAIRELLAGGDAATEETSSVES